MLPLCANPAYKIKDLFTLDFLSHVESLCTVL